MIKVWSCQYDKKEITYTLQLLLQLYILKEFAELPRLTNCRILFIHNEIGMCFD